MIIPEEKRNNDFWGDERRTVICPFSLRIYDYQSKWLTWVRRLRSSWVLRYSKVDKSFLAALRKWSWRIQGETLKSPLLLYIDNFDLVKEDYSEKDGIGKRDQGQFFSKQTKKSSSNSFNPNQTDRASLCTWLPAPPPRLFLYHKDCK